MVIVNEEEEKMMMVLVIKCLLKVTPCATHLEESSRETHSFLSTVYEQGTFVFLLHTMKMEAQRGRHLAQSNRIRCGSTDMQTQSFRILQIKLFNTLRVYSKLNLILRNTCSAY